MRVMLTSVNIRDKLTPVKFTGVYIPESVMFATIGRFAANHAKAVLAGTLLVLIAAGAFGFTAFGKLKAEGFDDPAAESVSAQQLIKSEFGGSSDLVFLVTARSGSVDEPSARTAGAALSDKLAAD